MLFEYYRTGGLFHKWLCISYSSLYTPSADIMLHYLSICFLCMCSRWAVKYGESWSSQDKLIPVHLHAVVNIFSDMGGYIWMGDMIMPSDPTELMMDAQMDTSFFTEAHLEDMRVRQTSVRTFSIISVSFCINCSLTSCCFWVHTYLTTYLSWRLTSWLFVCLRKEMKQNRIKIIIIIFLFTLVR